MSAPVRDRRGMRRLEGAGPLPLTLPASWAYRLGSAVFHCLHDHGLLAERRVDLPVISVGAVSAGGSGKTPVVRWLAERLAATGRRPAILSRGYRSRGAAAPRLVADRTGDAVRDGDEPVLLAGSLPGVPVIVGRDRACAAELARAEGADVLLLDDGFQHRRLQRDLDIVLWDRRSAQARGRLLPAGSLREALRGLARADVLLLVDRGDGEPSRPEAGPSRAFGVRLRLRCLSAAGPGAALHALTGLADGASFEASLVRAGFELTGATRYPDHHFFTMSEIREATAQAGREGAHHLAVTAKDYVRWPDREGTGLAIPAVFDLGVEVDRETELLRIITEAMEGAGR